MLSATDPAPDDGYEPSGVKSIQLPDETVVDADSAELVVKINGSYEFVITDNAGNKTTLMAMKPKSCCRTYRAAMSECSSSPFW